jgi:hypothetical protein
MDLTGGCIRTIFESSVRSLQHASLLWIQRYGFGGRNREEGCIKLDRIVLEKVCAPPCYLLQYVSDSSPVRVVCLLHRRSYRALLFAARTVESINIQPVCGPFSRCAFFLH